MKKLTDIDVVYFDMGNTLIHFHEGDSDEVKNRRGLIRVIDYLKELGIQLTLDEIKEKFFDIWVGKFPMRKKLMKEFSIDEELNGFLKEYDIKLTNEECIEVINVFYEDYKKQLVIEHNLSDTLKYIKSKGYKVGIISNTAYYEEVMVSCFKEVGIHEYIDEYTFSYGLKICKPRREIFNVALEKMKVGTECALMVGDRIDCDLNPAKELGMKVIWLNKKKETIKEEHRCLDGIISELNQLKEIL